jgi:hypothetical protein
MQDELCQLSKFLDLNHNQISTIPIEISYMNELFCGLSNNPIKSIQ